MSQAARPWLKICGITREADAELAVSLGADAIGLNFVGSSKRRIDETTARAIAARVRGRVELIGVVANESHERALALADSVGLDWLQLHGDEAPSELSLLPRAFKAIGIADAADASRAAGYPGERLLVDTKAGGALGGSGQRFDWSLVESLASARRLILAGGLDAENVAEAIAQVRPWGVDVASGVEDRLDPRHKDPGRMAQFIREARRAAQLLADSATRDR